MKAHLERTAVSEGRLARYGLNLANWSERWFPDPLVFALLGIVVVFLLGLLAGEKPADLAIQGGKSFWSLVPFTMQMVMIIIGGYVVSSTPAVSRLLERLAMIPKNPRTAIAMVALFSMLTSLISWGLSTIFSALLVRRLARHVKGMDYRAAGTAAYLGVGTVWALGLSSSSAMLMATRSSIPPQLFAVSGLIPLTQTIFLWQSLVCILVLTSAAVMTAWLTAPSAANAKTAEDFGLHFDSVEREMEPRTRPGEWLEYSPLSDHHGQRATDCLSGQCVCDSPQGPLAALDLNTYNLMFLTAGLAAALAASELRAGGRRGSAQHRWSIDSVSPVLR